MGQAGSNVADQVIGVGQVASNIYDTYANRPGRGRKGKYGRRRRRGGRLITKSCASTQEAVLKAREETGDKFNIVVIRATNNHNISGLNGTKMTKEVTIKGDKFNIVVIRATNNHNISGLH